MRKEIITCDRCDVAFINGVTNAYITAEGNGSAKSSIIDGKDFCRECFNRICDSIRIAVKRPLP